MCDGMVPFSWWRRQAVPLHDASPAAWEHQNLHPLSVGHLLSLSAAPERRGMSAKAWEMKKGQMVMTNHKRWGGFDFIHRPEGEAVSRGELSK